MGEMADDLLDRMMFEWDALEEAIAHQCRRGADTRVWTMGNGQTILLEDMTDSHLRRTIAMLQENYGGAAAPWIKAMQKELDSRPPPAEMFEALDP